MILKLFFITGLFFLYFLLKTRGQEIQYFYLTILVLCIRVLDTPYLGDITPATVMICAMFLGTYSSLDIFKKDNIPFILTLVIAIILGVVNVDFNIPRMLKWSLLLFNVLVLSNLTQYYITDDSELKKFTWYIIATCLIFSVTTLIGYWGLGDGTVIYNANYSYFKDEDILHASRIYGITSSNLVQIISVISICLIPSLKLTNKKFEYAIIAIFVIAALVTLKRMSFIAIIFSLGYYLIIQYKEKNYTALAIVTIIAVSLIGMWWNELAHRFEIAGIGSNGNISDHSTQSRFDRIGFAIAAFKKSPIFGMGSGYVTFVHNGFFEILGNCGILGLITIFLKFIPNIKDIIKGNPWAIATILYVTTCFSLESAINNAQIIYFLGLYLGGYHVYLNINKYEKSNCEYA